MDNNLLCPECESSNVVVTEETMWYANGYEVFCHSVKSYDNDAKAECLDCEWKGHRKNLINS